MLEFKKPKYCVSMVPEALKLENSSGITREASRLILEFIGLKYNVSAVPELPKLGYGHFLAPVFNTHT